MNHVFNKAVIIVNTVRSLVLVTAVVVTVKPAGAVEFNTDIIEAKDRANVNLSHFERAGYVPPGEYLLDVSINGRGLSGQQLIRFLSIEDGKSSRMCLPPDLVSRFGLLESALQGMAVWNDGQCVSFDDKPDAHVNFDAAQQRLIITFPQAWMIYQNNNWVGPEMWDNGIPGLIFDYNILASRFEPRHGKNSNSISSYGTVGANAGAWRLRADYQYSNNQTDGSGTNTHASWSQIYAFRPLPSMGARLVAGQTFLNSDIFDSFRFTGASINTDDRMLPPSLRGYAPQVNGIAQTNAKVIISQQGRIVYQTKVTPGPFSIKDLSNVVHGVLDVRVEEEDGKVSTFQVNAASVPFLTRKGSIRYRSAVGKPTVGNSLHLIDPAFYMGEMSWGAFNDTSIYGGLIATSGNNYNALALGVGQNLHDYGAISFDVTRSDADLPQRERKSAFSYRVNYSKRFDSTNTQVTFAGYRFSERGFLSMNQYLDKKTEMFYSRDDKETYTLSANQYLKWPDITVYLSATHKTYWDDVDSDTYNLSMSKVFDIGDMRNVSATLSAAKVNYAKEDDKQVYFSLSLPVGTGQQVSYDATQDSDRGFVQTATYYNTMDRNNTWRISAGGTTPQFTRGEPILRAGYQHTSPYGEFGLDGSNSPKDYSSISANWYGSLTLTPRGAAFHQNSAGNEPRLMVDTNGVEDVSFNGGSAKTNSAGIAVISSTPSYQSTDINVDMNTLPDNTEIYDSVVQRTLTEGAIGYRRVRAVQGQRFMAQLTLQDGRVPPMGATIVDRKTGIDAGIVGENGLAYLTGVTEADLLEVRWDDKAQCRIRVIGDASIQDGVVSMPCL